MQKIDAFICLFTNKREALRPGDEEKAPGPHPVWTCHTQGHEKTVLLMDAESGLWGCLSLSLSLRPSASQKKGRREKEREWHQRIGHHGVGGVKERQTLRVVMQQETRRLRQGQTGFRNQEVGSATDALTLPQGRLMTSASLLSD